MQEHEEFITPASDAKGHSTRLWVRAQPMIGRVIEKIVQSKKFPYRTSSDLIRHALNRHLEWLRTQGRVTSLFGQVEAVNEVLRDEEIQSDFVQIFTKLRERISVYMADGSANEALRLVMTIRAHVEEMPNGFWKDRYMKQIEDNYGHLLKNTRKAKLGTMEV